MTRTAFVRDAIGWGLALWLIGYILGLVAFALVPTALIGWVVTPFGTLITLWVLLFRIPAGSMRAYAVLSLAWTVIAVALDYAFIVKLFNPPDGYYKFDVYVYYALTFSLPLAVGWWKTRSGGQHGHGRSARARSVAYVDG